MSPGARDRAQLGGGARKRVAVMQPYFFPYAGYFRLLYLVDHFVVFDCVQFPRRGRVHRTEVPGPSGTLEWLTLPLAAMPRETRIRDLAFLPDARARFDARLKRHAWLAAPEAAPLRAYLDAPFGTVVDYLVEGLELVAGMLGLAADITRSSDLALDPALRAQDRVIAACRAVGGTDYVNPPGGRALYDPAAFAAAGLRLFFLGAYRGPHTSMLPALASLPPAAIRADIAQSSVIEEARP